MKLIPSAALFIAIAATAHARLGESEAQSQARYGAPDNNLIAPKEDPLLPGARELAYAQPGWRIRAAFIGGTTVKIEYRKNPEGEGTRIITPDDVKLILDAEKAKGVWRGDTMGPGGRRVRRDEDEARRWERSDRATAEVAKTKITLQLHDAEERAAKAAKVAPPAKPGPTPARPKF